LLSGRHARDLQEVGMSSRYAPPATAGTAGGDSVRPRSKSGPCRKRGPLVVVAIADDELRREYSSHLTENGFAAPAVATEVEAIGLAQRLTPELVVLELSSQGIAAAELLRSGPYTQHIGIVAVARPSVAAQAGVADGGAFDVVLDAPCSATTLLTELLAMLARVMPDDDPEPSF
jgi:DNA-binding response OmpR family regulator